MWLNLHSGFLNPRTPFSYPIPLPIAFFFAQRHLEWDPAPPKVYGLFGAVLRPAGARRLLEASSLEPAVRFGLGLLESS